MGRMCALIGVLLAASLVLGDEAAVEPKLKISSYAPAPELLGQVEYYAGRMETSLAAEADYDEAKQARVQKDALTLMALTTALGFHDEPNRLQKSAATLAQRAAEMAEGRLDYGKTRAAFDQFQAAKEADVPSDTALSWKQNYEMVPLMKQVATVEAALRRSLSKSRFEKDAEKAAGLAATLAVLGQATLSDTHTVKNPNDLPTWNATSAAWRDEAGAVGTAIRQRDYAATNAAMMRMTKACADCHVDFRP